MNDPIEQDAHRLLTILVEQNKTPYRNSALQEVSGIENLQDVNYALEWLQARGCIEVAWLRVPSGPKVASVKELKASGVSMYHRMRQEELTINVKPTPLLDEAQNNSATSTSFIKLAAMKKTLDSLSVRSVYFDWSKVQTYFERYAAIRDSLKISAPDLYGDLPVRKPPEFLAQFANQGEIIHSSELRQLREDIEYILECSALTYAEIPSTGTKNMTLDIFISHSSKDTAIAKALIDLLRQAYNLSAAKIRCTSVEGYKLTIGADANAQLKAEVHGARVFIALLTPASIASVYVLFELGARWGADLYLMPVLAGGAEPSLLRAPLSGIHSATCATDGSVMQLVDDVAQVLEVTPERPTVYHQAVTHLVEVSKQAGVKYQEQKTANPS